MRILPIGAASLLALAYASTASAAWTPLTTQPTFPADTALLLTDGTVMVHALATPDSYGSSAWYRLTPDIDGSYVNGTWSAMPSMPSTYAPLYFTSAVLPDGRVLIEGGEYNVTSQSETTLGEIFDPAANTWTAVSPPSGWGAIGDAPSVILGDGTLLMGSSETTQQALFNPKTLGWTTTGTGKGSVNSESGFTLLPDGKVFTIDAAGTPDAAELYDAATGAWTSAGTSPVALADAAEEIGPQILLEDGSVFAVGATGNTALYHPAKGKTAASWAVGPKFPLAAGLQLDAADGPAALMPNGDVLCIVSPGDYQAPVHAFVYNGKTLTEAATPANAATDPSYVVRLLVLPTGDILYLDGNTQASVFTGSGAPKAAWAPTIATVRKNLTTGKSYELTGTQLNGNSAGAVYGDDAQMSTNYPLVRITNVATGHVFYARTHDHSTMAVATGTKVVSTHFAIAAATEKGASMLEVVANGIASDAVSVTVD